MSAVPQLGYTAADLERLSDGGCRYELVAGELRPMSPVGGDQGAATINLSAEATTFVRRHGLGTCFAAETGFLLAESPATVLAPAWAFIRTERMPLQHSRGYVRAVPDLVLETRSPNDSAREIQQKVDRWLEYGVCVVWDLDPVKQILTVHRGGESPVSLTGSDVLTEEPLLPGLEIRIADVF
jgi:Uma2 family endonuclease